MGRQTYSFFRRARAASVGPLAWSRMTSTRSTIPLRSLSSYCSLVRRSIWTVMAVYGFYDGWVSGGSQNDGINGYD